MSTLRTSITELASHFAAGVLSAIRGASLEEILAETNRTGFSGAGAKGGATGVKRGPGRPKGSGASRASNGAVASAPAEKSGGKKGRRGRLGRRSAADIGAVVERIVALLGQNPKGLRAEEIRAKLGLDAKELPRPIADALAAKKISKQGEKRATTYFARGGGGGKAAPASGGAKRGPKKGGAKAAGQAKRGGAKKGKRGPKGSRKAAATAAASSAESAPAETTES